MRLFVSFCDAGILVFWMRIGKEVHGCVFFLWAGEARRGQKNGRGGLFIVSLCCLGIGKRREVWYNRDKKQGRECGGFWNRREGTEESIEAQIREYMRGKEIYV